MLVDQRDDALLKPLLRDVVCMLSRSELRLLLDKFLPALLVQLTLASSVGSVSVQRIVDLLSLFLEMLILADHCVHAPRGGGLHRPRGKKEASLGLGRNGLMECGQVAEGLDAQSLVHSI